MKLRLSEDARNGMVQVIADLIDSGGRAGRIELMAANGKLLSTLKFAFPSAESVHDGELMFKPIAEDPAAVQSGLAQLAHILSSGGSLILECDVTANVGDGVIRLNSNDIKAGGPVRITSFRLSVPA